MSQTCTRWKWHDGDCGLGPALVSVQVVHDRAARGESLELCGRWIGKYGEPFHRVGLETHDGLSEQCPKCTTHGQQPCGCVWGLGKLKAWCAMHMRMGLEAGLVLKDGELIQVEER